MQVVKGTKKQEVQSRQAGIELKKSTPKVALITLRRVFKSEHHMTRGVGARATE